MRPVCRFSRIESDYSPFHGRCYASLMARLRHVDGPEELRLPARGIVGRSKASNIALPGRWLSSEHASIGWMGDSWVLRDLSSRNGTFVDGVRADAGRSIRLRAGAR